LNKIKWSTEEEWGSSEDGNALFDVRSHPLKWILEANSVAWKVSYASLTALENFMINWCIPFKLRT